MKLPNFKKFLIENLSDEDAAELGAMGFSNINANEIAELIDIHDFRIKAEGSKLLIVGDLSMPEDDFYLLQGIDMSELDLERDFWGEIQITLDFDNSTVTGSGLISQKDMDLWEEFDLDDIDWNDIFQNGDPSSMSSQEIAQEIESFLEVVHGYEDSSGYYDKIRELISDKVEQLTGREEDEDEDDNEEDDEDWMAEKKLLKFHDSDAPDANGKFIWPGFGDNMRVLKWMLERIDNKVAAKMGSAAFFAPEILSSPLNCAPPVILSLSIEKTC